MNWFKSLLFFISVETIWEPTNRYIEEEIVLFIELCSKLMAIWSCSVEHKNIVVKNKDSKDS